MLADSAETEVSRISKEKEQHTVEQTERQVAQAAHQATLHNIHTALDSISKRVTVIEETQQRDWQTLVQQHNNIAKIETQLCSNSRQCSSTRGTHSTYRQVNTVSVSTRAQHERDKVDAPERVADGKVRVAKEDDLVTVHKANGEGTEVHSEAGDMNVATPTTFRSKGIHAPRGSTTSSVRQHCRGHTRL
mmetsp:Transcript_26666/g.39208  ORF Transcript_26666/g.39208 Transcript_26666/m.39208 type:complete len:190 (-) Transcript_26666:224-793(-)